MARDFMIRMVHTRFPNSTLFVAGNGIEGVELFMRSAPDIVVTDINMPLMEGFEMIRQINSIHPGASIIVLTAYSDKITYEKFRDLSVIKYLLKPLDFNELFAAIGKCLAEPVSEPTVGS